MGTEKPGSLILTVYKGQSSQLKVACSIRIYYEDRKGREENLGRENVPGKAIGKSEHTLDPME